MVDDDDLARRKVLEKKIVVCKKWSGDEAARLCE
jgi:hypothetical protein